jgi:hypothetical protein
MPRLVFQPTIPVFKRAQTVHASDSAATVITPSKSYRKNKYTHIYLFFDGLFRNLDELGSDRKEGHVFMKSLYL